MRIYIIRRPFLSLLVLALLLFFNLNNFAEAGTYKHTIDVGSYEIVDLTDGYQEINMEGFGQLFDPGKPKLPSKIFTIAIPPGTSVVSVSVEGADVQQLPGVYNILPVPSPMPGNGDDKLIKKALDLYDKNYQATYSSNAPYPEARGAFISHGGYRKYNIVNVRFTPFDYRPQSGELYLFSRATVTIEYKLDAAADINKGLFLKNLPEVEDKAKKILDNHAATKNWYPLAGAEPGGGLYEFVIVTIDDLVDAVQPLVDWERSKGRTVYVATTTWINANYSGADLQRRIRYFLRDKYPSAEWGILKVCLVGDLTDVPMRYCDVRKTGSSNTATLTPTDYYYAELTSTDSASWDDDWDGFFGERGDDTIDFITEVDVGRIPWSYPAIVESICIKMANYENSSYTAYKKRVLLPEAFWDASSDNAVLAQKMWDDFYSGSGYTRWRIYEYGPTFYSTYSRDRTLTHANVVADWNNSEFGSVCWSGHGNRTSVSYDAHHSWLTLIQASDYTSLDDDHPSVIYSNSCSTAYPEVESLGRNMMRSRGVAFVGSARVMWYMPGWDELSDGWGNTLAYLFSKKSRYGGSGSIGWSHTHALRDMYTTYGWDGSDDGWVSMFEYVLYGNPDLWIRARPALPNLDYLYRTGWDYPIVPRSAAGATTTWCPVTSTLPGNTADTYLNWTWENNGGVASPAAKTRIFVDERWIAYSTNSVGAGSSRYFVDWDYGPNITGGRHSLYYRLDEDEEVWETSEYDNFWGRQFVWSPYALADDTPIYRASPPHKDAWASPYWYNNDGFSFYVGSAYPNKYWSAVGILPSNSDADYDLWLWGIGDYSGSEQGFGSGSIEQSSWGSGGSDFVIVNDNAAAAGTYYAGAINHNNETGNYHIEEATSTKIFSGSNGPYSMSNNGVLDIYEFYAGTDGDDYGFKMEQSSGTCDLGMSLYDDETVHAKKNEYMTGGYANSNGDGADELMQVTIPDKGFHGLVVWKADSSDYSKTTTYTIKVGKCAIPGALSGPSPVDGATDVSINADLNWADSSDTEYYEVWLKEGSADWVDLGDTETSFWVLGTLNEATSYQWFIRANNICGNSVYTFWNFTTEDNTPPIPNPMTWVSIPYETSTSSISMAATAATDPTTPITYFFDFYNSPTGGLGGNNSSWQTSTSFTDSGLSVNHQYSYRVMAQDGSGNNSAYSSISYDFTDIEASNGVVFGTITNSSIQARSSNTPSNLTFAKSGLRIDTTGSTSDWKKDNNFWTNASLTPNTKHEYKVLTRNGDANITVWSPTSSRYTLANIPVAAAFSNVTQASIRANWSANGNPAGTAYFCENTTTGADSGWTKNLYWNNTGLACETTYSYLVRARNYEGVETGLVNLGSQATLDCSSPPCPGDFDGDGDVDDDDLAILAGNFGRNSCSACDGDFDGDGDVDGVDLAQFLTVYGHPCP